LGDSHDAVDDTWLRDHNIGAVLNLINMRPGFNAVQRRDFERFYTDYEVLLQREDRLTSWYQRKLRNPDMLYLNIPTDDSRYQSLFDIFPKSSAFINSARTKPTNILVHCFAGQNRSAAVVVAWMIEYFPELTLRDAILAVDKARTMDAFHILTNESFTDDLMRYCLFLRSKPEQCLLPDGNGHLGWK
jgi:protein-tyrosine phosphatase